MPVLEWTVVRSTSSAYMARISRAHATLSATRWPLRLRRRPELQVLEPVVCLVAVDVVDVLALADRSAEVLRHHVHVL